MKMSTWYDEENGIWYATSVNTEKCYAGFYTEIECEEWIEESGYELE